MQQYASKQKLQFPQANQDKSSSEVELPQQVKQKTNQEAKQEEKKLNSVEEFDLINPYRVNPRQGYESPNFHSPYPLIAINGMAMHPYSILDMAQGLANQHGRTVHVVPNHTQGFLKDTKNGVVSVFHNQKGIEAEKVAASNLKTALVQRLNDDYPIELTAYSQGTLITKNVLFELRKELGQQAWQKFASRIKLRTFGAAFRAWPEPIRAKEHSHVDLVALIGAGTSAQQRVQSLFNNQGKLNGADVVVFPQIKNAHSYVSYIKNNAEFILRDLQEFNPGLQATLILGSMSRSDYSSKEYEKLIDLITKPSQDPNSSVYKHNSSVILSKQIYNMLASYPTAALQLNQETIDSLSAASKTALYVRESRAGEVRKPGKVN